MKQEVVFRKDGRLEISKGYKSVVFSEDFTNQIVAACTQEYAKRALIQRLVKELNDGNPSYSKHEVPVSIILQHEGLLNAIAGGLVGTWGLDLEDSEHMDNEISFWIDMTIEENLKDKRSEEK